MSLETVRMSSKGQVVIPQDIRNDINVSEGTVFAVIGSKDTIILKKIATPSKEDLIRDLRIFAKKAKAKLKKKGISEKNLQSK